MVEPALGQGRDIKERRASGGGSRGSPPPVGLTSQAEDIAVFLPKSFSYDEGDYHVKYYYPALVYNRLIQAKEEARLAAQGEAAAGPTAQHSTSPSKLYIAERYSDCADPLHHGPTGCRCAHTGGGPGPGAEPGKPPQQSAPRSGATGRRQTGPGSLLERADAGGRAEMAATTTPRVGLCVEEEEGGSGGGGGTQAVSTAGGDNAVSSPSLSITSDDTDTTLFSEDYTDMTEVSDDSNGGAPEAPPSGGGGTRSGRLIEGREEGSGADGEGVGTGARWSGGDVTAGALSTAALNGRSGDDRTELKVVVIDSSLDTDSSIEPAGVGAATTGAGRTFARKRPNIKLLLGKEPLDLGGDEADEPELDMDGYTAGGPGHGFSITAGEGDDEEAPPAAGEEARDAAAAAAGEEDPEGPTVNGPGQSNFEDREFDFLKTEPVRRSTSLKTYKTPPGTPSKKKAVRFADALGLDLESVRHILNMEDPPLVPKSAMRDLHLTTKEDGTRIKGVERLRYLSPCFSQPVAEANFLRRVRDNRVALENCSVNDKDMTISGTVRVSNIAYHKSVIIRHSVNNWLTHEDVCACYVQNSFDGSTDRFAFTVCVPGYFQAGSRLLFAVQFIANEQTYWDNNHGRNYVVECYARAVPANQADNTWMHFL